jgi:hypothetical protein
MMNFALIAATLLMGQTADSSTRFVCTTAEKYVCTMGVGCQAGVTGAWAVVDFATGEYQRCDARGCDTYSATVTPSGQVINVEVPGKAAFIKVLPGGAFSEVASAGAMTILSYGYCVPQAA